MASRAAHRSVLRPPTRRTLLALGVSLAVALALVATATPAEAASRKPAKVSLSKTVHRATTSTLAVTWKRPARATRFGICLKTDPSAKRCARYVKTSRTSVTFRGLKPTGGHDYFYRIRAYNSRGSAVTGWKPANLGVNPAGAVTSTGGAGHYLSFRWSGIVNARTYEVQISPDPSFRSSTSLVSTSARSITIGRLNGGSTYYTRVRGSNDRVKGRFGPTLATRLPQVPVAVSVATYNLCGEDRCRPNTTAAFQAAVPTWKSRKSAAARLVLSAGSPDIIATQESVQSTTAFHTVLPGYTRGAYYRAKAIYFRADRFSALAGGGITLDAKNSKYASWNWLRDRRTGTSFFVVDAHLISGKGAANDALRTAQMNALTRQINALNPRRLPVIWAGDWNSNESNANQTKYPGGYDAPTRSFAALGAKNSLALTDNAVNADLNSANQGRKDPYANGDHVDAVFVSGTGIAVDAWQMLATFEPALDPTTGRRAYQLPFPSDHNPIVARLIVGTP